MSMVQPRTAVMQGLALDAPGGSPGRRHPQVIVLCCGVRMLLIEGSSLYDTGSLGTMPYLQAEQYEQLLPPR
jgi:hypothetical protein